MAIIHGLKPSALQPVEVNVFGCYLLYIVKVCINWSALWLATFCGRCIGGMVVVCVLLAGLYLVITVCTFLTLEAVQASLNSRYATNYVVLVPVTISLMGI